MKCLRLNSLFYFLYLVTAICFSQNTDKQVNYNYAYSCDGFNQDRDDVAASAMTLAIFDRLGMADRIVHFHFNTNFGGEATHAEEHRRSALQTAVLFGIIQEENSDDAFFDVARSEKEQTAAIEHLADQIGKANHKEPLMIFAAGGVQLPYLALQQAIEAGAEKSTLESIVFVSHARANEQTRQKNGPNPDYHNNWDDLKKLSPHVRFVDYTSPRVNGKRDGGVNLSQNSTAWNQAPRGNKGKGVSDWQWLKDYGEQVEGFGFSGTKGEWLLTRLKAAGAPEIGHNGNAEGDASDAGMVFTQLPGGITDATMEEIKDFFIEDWKLLLDKNMTHWEKFMGIPHSSVKGLPEGTFQSENVHKGTPLGLNNDPKNVISMIEQDGQPILAITGEIYGCVSTKEQYGDYHLSLQFKWGKKKWEPRLDKLRDSGILYHGFGNHGGIWNVWKACVESQVQEGECGDIYLLGSHQGNPNVYAKTVPTEGHRFPTWDPKGVNGPQRSRIIKKGNPEKPNGEWNTIEIYALGDQAFHVVNGQVVMHITQIKRSDEPLTSGYIQLQSEGAEIYYRDIKIRNISKFPENVISELNQP